MAQILQLRDLEMVERNTFDDFESPRHRRNFDQVRIQLQGDADCAHDGRYTGPVFLEPDTAEWVAEADAPGVMRKPLGRYSRAGTSLAMIALAPDATATIPPGAVLFALDGEGDLCDARGQTLGTGPWEHHSCVSTGSDAVRLTARTPSRWVEIGLPRL